MSCSFSWVGMKKIIFRSTLIIAIAYANMSYNIVFTLKMRQPDPQWVHKTEVYCVHSKCYAGGKDEHVHPTLLTLRLYGGGGGGGGGE